MPEEEKNFISLKEAAKHCQYSQEYLSLRARQGKLKAKKIGRNWATTVEWVKEYEKRMEAYKKGKEYKPEEKKKKKKVEKKREKEKSYANIKDHLVLLLTGVIIGIVISTLVINFILIYNFSGFGIETQKAFNRNSEKIGNRMNQFSFAVSKTAFDNLKIFEKDLNDKTRDFKEGLAYSGGVFEEMITRNSYKAASKVGKVELAVVDFSRKIEKLENQSQLAKVDLEKEEKLNFKDKLKASIKEFVYSLAFYSNSLIESSKRILFNLGNLIT